MQHTNSFRLLTCGLVIAGAAVFFSTRPSARLADPVFQSAWRDTPLAVDGTIGDWTRLERLDQGPVVGFQNDAHSLYIAVSASDPELRRLLAAGLVVWFNPKSKKEQGSGLRIPGVVRRPLPGATPDAPAPEEIGRTASLRVLDQFDWLGPGKSQRKLVDVTAGLGVAIASGAEEGVFVYELGLPLQASTDHPYAVDAVPGSTIAVGFETPSDPPLREGRGSGGGLGGRGGGRGGRGGGMSPGGGRGDFAGDRPANAMKLVWVRVKLAVAN
jgi:uncharacterized membrane protein YgcG